MWLRSSPLLERTHKTGSAATVTVTDQFGRPFKGAGIILTSDNPDSVLPTKARITSGNGQVRIGYSYTGGASDEALTATYTSLGADGEAGGGDDVTATGTATAYWVTATIRPSCRLRLPSSALTWMTTRSSSMDLSGDVDPDVCQLRRHRLLHRGRYAVLDGDLRGGTRQGAGP